MDHFLLMGVISVVHFYGLLCACVECLDSVKDRCNLARAWTGCHVCDYQASIIDLTLIKEPSWSPITCKISTAGCTVSLPELQETVTSDRGHQNGAKNDTESRDNFDVRRHPVPTSAPYYIHISDSTPHHPNNLPTPLNNSSLYDRQLGVSVHPGTRSRWLPSRTALPCSQRDGGVSPNPAQNWEGLSTVSHQPGCELQSRHPLCKHRCKEDDISSAVSTEFPG